MSGENTNQKIYSFTDDEFEKLQSLFSVLQNDISSAEAFPEKTGIKLLEKLEEIILHSERNMNDLDSLWSFIGRTEIAFRVYGKNNIPDALKEMLKIIWKVQCRVEGRAQNSLPPINL